MRRAAISICSNIAEGSGRTTKPDQTNFYRISYSSLLELLNQLIISTDLAFITDSELIELREKIDSIAFKLSSLRNSL
jgi:four helix bundle protein